MQRFGLEKKGVTPQTKKIPGRKSEMKKNDAGGAVFKLDKWKRLERFIVLGSEGGSFYVSEQKQTKRNTTNLEKCIAEDGPRTVAIISTISNDGRAFKNDTAIFALAFCASKGDAITRKCALEQLPMVCRIGTHLFHFVEYVEALRGWGRGLRTAIAKWYTTKSNDKLAMQLLKYKQRDGWSHCDVLRLCHAKPVDETQSQLFKCAVGKESTWPSTINLCEGYNKVSLKEGLTVAQSAELIREYKIPRELLSTDLLNEKLIWEAMLPSMPLTALIRNLGKMGSIGMFSTLSANIPIVVEKLTNQENINKSRLHPMSILIASRIYAKGRNDMGAKYGRSMSWTPNGNILAALENAFYMAFKNVEPSGKRMLLALDVSGSMTRMLSGTPISCREASALMAMVTARTEKEWGIVGFTSGSVVTYKNPNRAGSRNYWGGEEGITELSLNPSQSLNDIVREVSRYDFGATDCALPMLYANAKGIMVDTFIVYTDSETWSGNIHPIQALKQYRDAYNPYAKLIVCGMTATGFTIADPEDAGMLDVVGFDTNTPSVIASFSKE